CATFPVTVITTIVLISVTILINNKSCNIASPTLIKLTAEGTNNTGIIKINQSETSSTCFNFIIPENKQISIIERPYTLAGIGIGKVKANNSPIKLIVIIIKN